MAGNKLQESVLLVDDEPDFLEILVAELEGFSVLTATKGAEALDILECHEVFCIISDFRMEPMSGLELLRACKEARPNVPFFLLTGDGDKNTVAAAVNSGLDGYFDKPVNGAVLRAKVEDAAASRLSDLEHEKAMFAIFFEEAGQFVSEIEFKILNLDANPDNLLHVKRSLHTLKGNSSFFPDFHQIRELCHKAEDMLAEAAKNGLTLAGERLDAMIAAKDMLDTMLSGLKIEIGRRWDLEPLLARLAAASQANGQAEPRAGGGDAAPFAEAAKKNGEAGADGIFVPSGKLDALMALGGELVVVRNFLGDIVIDKSAAGLMKLTRSHGDDELRFKEIYKQIDALCENIQSTIMKIREVPIGNVFRPYFRVVRDVARSLGKNVKLVVDDGGIAVDKNVGQALGEAMVHLVRNAVDHGIELPADRLAVGKPAEATLTIRAQRTRESTSVEIADDGRGINRDAVLKKAVQQGLITKAEQSLTDAEVLGLIFQPGFSTAAAVSEISGRGVGLDIVRSAIEKLGGKVRVESRMGLGTTFKVIIPAVKSINISKAILARNAGINLVIPLADVDSIAVAQSTNVGHYNNDEEFLRLGDRIISLRNLGDLVDMANIALPACDKSVRLNKKRVVIILRQGARRLGLIVDEVVDQVQLVVKDFDKSFKVEGFKGKTILTNGLPALVIDTEWVLGRTAQGKAA